MARVAASATARPTIPALSRQGQAFRQQRSREPGAAGAQRDADRQLRQPGHAAREREPGDVDRRHQPHQQRRPGEQPHDRARSGTGHLLAERHDADAARAGSTRWRRIGARQDRLELALRWLDGGARAQPADHEPRAGTRRGAPRVPVREQRVRLPHVGGEAGLGHRVRQHADDPRRLAVDQHRRPEDGVRPAEAGAPESMAQEREPLAFLGVAIGEETAAIGDHAEQAEQVRRDAGPADLLELAGVRERHRHGVEDRHVREAAALPAPRLDGAEGGSAFAEVLIGNFDPHHRQAIGRWERQRPQQHGVQHSEHRGAGADGEGQRQDRAGGEARAAAEAAQGVAKLEEHDGDLRSAPPEHATPRRDGLSLRPCRSRGGRSRPARGSRT